MVIKILNMIYALILTAYVLKITAGIRDNRPYKLLHSIGNCGYLALPNTKKTCLKA